MSLPVVLVYLGPRLPTYATLNLQWMRRTFPHRDLFLITDNRASLGAAEQLGVRTWLLQESLQWETVRKNLPSSAAADFRDGFWFHTIARFYAMAQFMEDTGIGPILHLEADVWLAPDFPFEALEALDCDLAFPLHDPLGGVASTLLIRNAAAAKLLIDTAETLAHEGTPSTDMSLLHHVRRLHPDRCIILPTAAPQFDALDLDLTAGAPDEFMRELDRFGGVFDAIAWGHDVLGEDPRNHWGFRVLFSQPTHSPLQTNRLALAVDAEGRVRAGQGSAAAPVFSLHVHSKDLAFFRDPPVRLAQRIEQRRHGHRREFVPAAAYAIITEMLKRHGKRLARRMARKH